LRGQIYPGVLLFLSIPDLSAAKRLEE